MINRHTLSLALLTALAGVSAPYDVQAESMAGYRAPAVNDASTPGKAVERKPFYVRHARGRNGELEAELRGQGGEIRYYLDRLETFVVELPVPAIEAMRASKNVALVEAVPEFKLAAQVVPWNIDQFQARDVWDKNRDGVVDVGAPDGSGIKICVVDTGFHLGHSDFAGITVNGTSEGTVGNWFEDGNGHGTHVAGTINAVNNNRGVVGVLPGGAELYIVKVFNNSGTWGGGSLAAAANKCRLGGANVISMSLGGGASQTEENMFQDLYDNFGILNVAAAGNDGNDVPSAPAMYESVVMVGAINEQEVAAEFSQTPPTAYDPLNPPANLHWDMTEFTGGGVQVLSTVPTPDGEVPVYRASFGGVDYYGSRVAADAPEQTLEGNVSGTLVNGGRCRLADPAQTWTGNVVMCERGDVSFAEKVNKVRAQGGTAVIIYNNVAGDLGATCGPDCDQPSIRALALSQEKGQALLAAGLGQSVNVLIDDGSPCVGCEGGYDFYSGTSMATPGVSSAMAFVWNACGGPTQVTNKQLRQLLRDTARDMSGVQPFDPAAVGGAEGPGDEIAYGAGYDRVTGWGLVQLGDALQLGNQRFGASCPLALVVTPTVRDICTLDATSTTFSLTLDDQFTGSSTASAGSLPAGTSGSFSVNPVVHPVKNTVYTLSNLQAAAAGVHEVGFTVVDSGNANNIGSATVDLSVTHVRPGTVALQAPANGATGVTTLPTLSWQAAAGATEYLVQVSTSPSFGTIVHTANVTGTSHTLNTMLSSDTQYFWRVTPLNGCGAASPAVASFRTGQMFCAAPGSAIPDNNNTGVSSTINVPLTGNLTDVDVAVMISHTWVGDLVVRLTHGATVDRNLIDRPGGAGTCAGDEIDATLDDAAASAVDATCPPVGTFRPDNTLSVWNGTAANGNWTLNVRDRAVQDAGTFDAWCVIPRVSAAGANAAPVFQNEPYAFAVAQNAAGGTAVGSITATDANAGNVLTYAITGGNTGNAFAINTATGAITVATSAAVTPANSPFTLAVSVSDGVSGVDTSSVTVTVTGGNQAPSAVGTIANRTDIEGAAVTQNTAANFTDANGDTLTYSATGLPTGLSINATTGVISGTLAFTANAGSPFSVVVTATDPSNATATQAFTWTVTNTNRAPNTVGTIANRTDAEGAAVTQNTAANFADADSDTLTYSATGLPGGLSINATTGVISGTIAFTANAGSPFSVVVTAADPSTTTATQAFTWTVSNTNQAPNAVGTIANRTDAEGAAVTQNTAANFADADSDTLTYSATGLPAGLTINPSTGVISGTIAFTANAGSPFSVVVTAADAGATPATQAFTWTVSNTNQAPNAVGTIANRTDAEGAAVTQNTAANFADADSDTLTYSATGLPNGLTINPSTGVISGTIAFNANAGSPFSVVVTATDAGATPATQSFTWTVSNTNQAPNAVGTIANRTDAEGAAVTQNTAANFADADSDTLTYSATGLPGGLTINPSTGVISGTIAFTANADSPFSVVVTAADAGATPATQAFTWTVSNTNQAPNAVGTIANRTDAEGASVTQNTAANFADADSDTLTYSATGLPAGLTINPSTGVISGTIAFNANAGSPFSVVVTAADAGATPATQAFTWTVSNTNQAPNTVGTIANRTDAEGAAVTQNTAANFADADSDTLTYSATGLPAGLTINPSTGVISGTIAFTANAGSPFSVVVTAADAGATPATQAFTWTVSNTNQAPNAVGTIANRTDAEGAAVTQNTAANFADADSDTLTYSATGLPNGLTINPSTGVISGTIAFNANAGSPFSVVVTAADAGATPATQAFTWTVSNTNQAPNAVGTIANRTDAEGASVTQNTAANFADADSDTLTYSATGLPAGLTINPSTGVISGTIAFTANASSPFSVVVTAADAGATPATQAFTWTVSNTNQAPNTVGTIANRTDAEGAAVTQNTAANFADADSDTLTYSATGLPAGLTINPSTGVISGTIAFTANASSPFSVVVTAADAGATPATQAFTWTVSNTNRAPNAVGTIANQTGTEGAAIAPLATAGAFADADGETLTWSATGLPPGLSIAAATGVISGTPSFASAGTHNVTVTARDPADASVDQAFVWTISGINQAPLANGTIADRSDAEGAVVSQATAARFSDPDGDVLVYSATGLPPGLSIDAFSGVIGGTLTFAAAGSHNVVVTARDPSNAGATRAFVWTVTNTNRAPTVTNEPYAFLITDNATAGAAVGTITGTDPDGDALVFSITGGNTGNGFAIDVATGAITVAAGGTLVGGTQVTLTVRVADAGGLDDTTSVTITVQSSGPVPDLIFRDGFED